MSASPEFRRLATAADAELAALVRGGATVTPEEVAGSTWRGWNHHPLFGVLRARKFLKRFLTPDAGGRLRGENVLAAQNDLGEPWRPRLGGRGILPFAVLRAGEGPAPGAPPQALVIAYGALRRAANPLSRIVDHLVRPDPDRPELLLGESLLLLGGGRTTFLEHFILERAGKNT